MARKPASMYRRLKGPAYTRRKYIGGVPNNRILAYHSGNRRPLRRRYMDAGLRAIFSPPSIPPTDAPFIIPPMHYH